MPGVAELLRPVTVEPASADERTATGREKHEHKITVYLSAGELLDLEHARLALRRLGVVIDRGRLVREAIAVLLADLDARGKDSLLARRIGVRVHAGDVPLDATGHAAPTPPQVGEPSITDGAGGPVPSLTWWRWQAIRLREAAPPGTRDPGTGRRRTSRATPVTRPAAPAPSRCT